MTCLSRTRAQPHAAVGAAREDTQPPMIVDPADPARYIGGTVMAQPPRPRPTNEEDPNEPRPAIVDMTDVSLAEIAQGGDTALARIARELAEGLDTDYYSAWSSKAS